MKKIVKKAKTCFVEIFETTSLEGYNLCELIDIINPVGIELHITIQSIVIIKIKMLVFTNIFIM